MPESSARSPKFVMKCLILVSTFGYEPSEGARVLANIQFLYGNSNPRNRAEGMTRDKTLLLKTYLMIAVMIFAGPLGNVFLAKGMRHNGDLVAWPPHALYQTALSVFASISIWCGVASLMVFFVAYMLVLSWADYSFVQPASSLAYGIVAIFGYLMLGERVSPLRWAGIAVICIGVFVVSRTAPSTAALESDGH
jgi:hypothetical protein